jgi:hypothetical protein
LPGLADPQRAPAGYRTIPALVDGDPLGENAQAVGQPRGAKAITERTPKDGLALMKKLAWASALLLAASPAAAQVATWLSQQQLGGRSVHTAPSPNDSRFRID